MSLLDLDEEYPEGEPTISYKSETIPQIIEESVVRQYLRGVGTAMISGYLESIQPHITKHLEGLKETPAKAPPQAVASSSAPKYVTPYLIDPTKPITIVSKIWKGFTSPESIIKISRNGVIYDWAQQVEKLHGPDFFVRQPVSENKDFIEYKTVLYTFTPAEFEVFVAGLRAQWEAEHEKAKAKSD